MPTGPKHKKFTYIYDEQGEDCRCTIGEDHNSWDDDNNLSESDAEAIWLSSGKDEDYDFR